MITRIKTFTDIIAIWTTQIIGWTISLNDLVIVASLVREILGILAFGAGLFYTIWKFRKERKKK